MGLKAVILLIALVYSNDFVNNRPIIGVLTGLEKPFNAGEDTSYLAESYV